MKRHVIAIAILSFGWLAAAANAEVIWNWSNAGNTYTIVQADPFYSGGTKGNTEALADAYGNGPNVFWATLDSQTTYKWNFRMAYAYNFNVLAGQDAAAQDVFECSVSTSGQSLDFIKAPDLRTTVGGLAAGVYDVFLVQAVRNDANMDNMVWMRADIDVGQAAPTTEHRRTETGIVWTGYKGSGGNSVFEIVLSPLGQVSGTNFSVLAGRGIALELLNPGRSHYVGVAYRYVGPVVPEPGTLALLAAGLVGMIAYAWRKRK